MEPLAVMPPAVVLVVAPTVVEVLSVAMVPGDPLYTVVVVAARAVGATALVTMV
jgi:hypothetical protein